MASRGGYGEIIVTQPKDTDAFRRAVSWYGCAAKSMADGTAVTAAILGDGLTAASNLLPHAEVTGVAIEFGVLPMMAVLRALQADAWLHAHGKPRSPEAGTIKQQLRAAFFDDRRQ